MSLPYIFNFMFGAECNEQQGDAINKRHLRIHAIDTKNITFIRIMIFVLIVAFKRLASCMPKLKRYELFVVRSSACLWKGFAFIINYGAVKMRFASLMVIFRQNRDSPNAMNMHMHLHSHIFSAGIRVMPESISIWLEAIAIGGFFFFMYFAQILDRINHVIVTAFFIDCSETLRSS